MGVIYSCSVIRSCNSDFSLIISSSSEDEGEEGGEKVIRYRRERSNRTILDKPHAAHIDVALDENADVNVERGPNSTIKSLSSSLLVVVKVLHSNCKPVGSNVSRNSHSRRYVASLSKSFVVCTLKQYSVSIRTMARWACRWCNCSLMDGTSE